MKEKIQEIIKRKSVINGCWQINKKDDGQGYVKITVGKSQKRLHRIFYENFVGPINQGMEIDHLCRNRACFNPKHLEAVTHKENVLRGNGIAAANKRKTHCKKGHLLSGANVYMFNNKKKNSVTRACRECHREKSAKWARQKYRSNPAEGARKAREYKERKKYVLGENNGTHS